MVPVMTIKALTPSVVALEYNTKSALASEVSASPFGTEATNPLDKL